MVRTIVPWLVIATLSGLLSACGSVSGASNSAAPATQVSAASCASLRPAKLLAEARVVLTGTMLPGVTLPDGNQGVLASPAAIRVIRYIKGRGPRMARVETAVTRIHGSIQTAEDGIMPKAGERWKIYSDSKRSPYQTATCAGSQQLNRSR